jgi:hypothetical protein
MGSGILGSLLGTRLKFIHFDSATAGLSTIVPGRLRPMFNVSISVIMMSAMCNLEVWRVDQVRNCGVTSTTVGGDGLKEPGIHRELTHKAV